MVKEYKHRTHLYCAPPPEDNPWNLEGRMRQDKEEGHGRDLYLQFSFMSMKSYDKMMKCIICGKQDKQHLIGKLQHIYNTPNQQPTNDFINYNIRVTLLSIYQQFSWPSTAFQTTLQCKEMHCVRPDYVTTTTQYKLTVIQETPQKSFTAETH